MIDKPDRTDGEEGGEQRGDILEATRPPVGALRTIEGSVVARRPAFANEPFASSERESSSSGGGLSGYLHAYRRRWFLATSLGLICGVAAAVAVWLSATTTYTSTALIRITADNPGIIDPVDKGHSSFELYKGTQMQLLTSDYVLIAALRKEDVANLGVLKREVDPVRWLARTLDVQAPENTEIVRLSLTTPDSNGGAAIVNSVAAAYLSEVVGKEGKSRADRAAELDRVYTEQLEALRSKRTQLKELEKQLGSGDKGALSIKEQAALAELRDATAELKSVQRNLQQIQYALAENQAKMAAFKAGRLKPPSPAEIENAVNSDPEIAKLEQALAALDNQLSQDKSVVKETLAKTLDERYSKTRKFIEDQILARTKKLAEHLKNVKSGDTASLEAEADMLRSAAANLTQDENRAAKEVEAQKARTELFGNSSIDVEMQRSELRELEETFDAVAHEREHARIESESQNRARISLIQPASPAVAPDKSSRLKNSIAGGLFGFLAPVGLLLWWDVRARRINSLDDISRGLGLRVIGTVPHMANSAAFRRKLNSRHQRKMQICLDHSIDGIAAKLCLRRDSRNARVVLVSSATHGEGKSTLSIQLAKRLARTGASTLLVDFDLRKPTLHHVFEMPRGPGLSEFLRGENELEAIVRPTDIENLSVLTAGGPFADSLGSLSNGVTRSLFKKVRDQFAFVVVDGSPILPVVDSLLASQHVDSVVLAIRRDVSTANRVQSACDQLAQFGVDEVVAVLTGSNEDLHYYEHPQEAIALGADDRPKPR
jgi:capsular exopolysaccharide synthesis family protein